jgi:Polyketide cyclase / dehydrase and lipid transport
MTLLEVRHISISIARAPQDVYSFASTIENVPRWASGLGGAIRNVNGDWVVDGPLGQVKLRFVEPNDLRILDHDVTLASGVTVHNPLRVVPNGTGSEVTFTLFRQPGMSDEQFAEDAKAVERDLKVLKGLLENR